MTGQERDYEAILSRVLHTTTDQLEPVGDGLTKIRARLSEPWLKRQWLLLRSELMVLRWLVVVRCESFFSTVRSRSGPADPAADPLAPLIACASQTQEHAGRPRSPRLVLGGITARASGKRTHRSAGPAMAWLRPALAVAGAVVLVVAGVFALGQIREGFILGLENATGANSSTTGHGTGNGTPQGGGAKFPGTGASSRGHSNAPKPGASTAHGRVFSSPGPCSPASTPPGSNPSPTASTSGSPSPSPTSASPSPSATSASPTPSTSQAPITSGIAGDSPKEDIGTTALVTCEQTPAASPSPSNQATAP